jgi:NAD(P)-dependent dehydrogenase (short-subunit alcohol dehydrogenase family)
MDLQLKGKTALITGASKGIGLGCAEILAQEGCNVHLAARSESALEAARQKLSSTGVKVTCHPLDLGVSENVTRLARDCGDVDILINNAGAIPQGSITDLDEKTWRAGWELKLFGYINLTREIYRRMTERRDGVIVNVIGGAGERPSAAYIAGSIANSGLITMSRALGADSPKYGVRVVGLNPGATATERGVEIWRTRAQKEFGDPERWAELTKGFPFGRAGTVEEVANVIVFLASPKASYVSGTVINVDGGSAWRK